MKHKDKQLVGKVSKYCKQTHIPNQRTMNIYNLGVVQSLGAFNLESWSSEVDFRRAGKSTVN